MTHEEMSQSTKYALSESLKSLMQKKPLSKITVSDITNNCNMNRKTFYYHFRDIYELFIWILEQEAVDVVKEFDMLLDMEDSIRFILNYVEKNAHLISCAFDSMGRDGMKRFLYKDFEFVIMKMITAMEEEYQKQLNPDYRIFLCSAYADGIAGIIINYLSGEMKLSKEQTVSYTSDFLKNTLPGIFSVDSSRTLA